MMKNIQKTIMFILFANLLTGCSKNDGNTKFVRPELRNAHPNDEYLTNNRGKSLLEKYGARVLWRWKDNFVKPGQSAAPIKEDLVIPVTKVIEFLWSDAYNSLGESGEKIIKDHFPAELVYIGSSIYLGSARLLGLAEQGTRITLSELNTLKLTNRAWYSSFGSGAIHTLHHEFSHFHHQKYGIPEGFNAVSPSGYQGLGWQNLYDGKSHPFFIALSMGMTSAYATSNEDEDFAELVANYLVADKQWFNLVFGDVDFCDEKVKRNWSYDISICHDIHSGKKLIRKKLAIVKKYYKEKFNIDLEELRKTIQARIGYMVVNDILPG